MGPRPLLLTGLLALALAAGCGGGDSPDPVPSPSPTRVPTGSPTLTSDENCPPITGARQTVSIPRGATTPLPDGGSIRLAEVTAKSGDTAASVVLEVTRKSPGCDPDATELDLPEEAGATVSGVQVDVVAVTTGGGVPPSVQIRFGPPA